MNIRTVLNLSQEAVDAIERHAPSPNKKGSWVSLAITEYARILAGVGDKDSSEAGILERMDNRLARIERQLTALQK